MKKLLVALLLVAVTASALWLYLRESASPEVPFAKARRETLVSTVVTNGKVEPLEWVAIRAGREGSVVRLLVEEGQSVTKNAPLVELDTRGAHADLAAAEAKIAQAKADLEALNRGGRASERVEIANSLATAQLELDVARQELVALSRLAEKQAATGREVTAARERVRKAEVQIKALKKKRGALVSAADRRATEARLRDAEASAAEARRRIELSVICAPMTGIVYDLETRQGSYVRPGDLVAEVGQLERARVVIYVDEPELGRVDEGMPITITWDALPGRQWTGAVERVPAQIAALGTRQVGEVTGLIENPELDLPARANINAEIHSRVADNALTIPKEALRRDGSSAGVFVLKGDRVAWRAVKPGISSITRAQIIEGLADGDAVALPAEVVLHDGDPVTPKFP